MSGIAEAYSARSLVFLRDEYAIRALFLSVLVKFLDFTPGMATLVCCVRLPGLSWCAMPGAQKVSCTVTPYTYFEVQAFYIYLRHFLLLRSWVLNRWSDGPLLPVQQAGL